MPKLYSTFALVAALMASTAFAQTATTPEATQAAEGAAAEATQATSEQSDTTNAAEGAAAEGAAAEGTATEGAAAEGAAQGQEQAQGQEKPEDPTYVKETHGDWQLKCFRTEGQDDPCQMFQLLKEDAGNPIAEFSLFRLKNGGQAVAGATVVVPLGTLLTEPLKISVDGGRAKSFPYSFCNMVGCYARIGLTADDLASFKNGNQAVLQIIPAQAPDKKVDIKASLTGFTAAFESSSVLEN